MTIDPRNLGALAYESPFVSAAGVVSTPAAHPFTEGQHVIIGRTNYTAVDVTPSSFRLRNVFDQAASLPDGSGTVYADDAAAFGLAFQEARPRGGHVHVAPGTYHVGRNVPTLDGTGAASSVVWSGEGSASVMQLHGAGLAAFVFQFANLDGVVSVRDLAFAGSDSAGDHDAGVALLFQTVGHAVVERCRFSGLYGKAAAPAYGAVIQHNADLAIRDCVFSACRGDTGVVVSEGVRNLTWEQSKILDVDAMNGTGAGKVAAQGPWFAAVDPQRDRVLVGADAGSLRFVGGRFDEAPATQLLFRTKPRVAPDVPRRYQSIVFEQTHHLVPQRGCAIDIADTDYVRLTGVEIGQGTNGAGLSDGALRFSGVRRVEMVATHASLLTDRRIVTDAATRVLHMRDCDGWDLSGVHESTLVVQEGCK